jgi:KDO2-lipid IV(A) lauroyltransferase
VLAVSFVGRRIPLRTGQRLGRAVGWLAWVVARRHRRKALQHLALAFPDWSEGQRRDVAREMFRHLGTSLFEVVWLPKLDEKRLAETTVFENTDKTKELIANGRAVVAFTGHLGNWEWLASSMSHHGIPLTALQRERHEGGLNDFIVGIRAAAGVKSIDRGSEGAGRELIRALRGGTLLGFLIDQSLRVESVLVPFFGHPAPTPIGPARMAIRAETHAVFIYSERLPDGRHRCYFSDPVALKRSDDPVELTARMTAEVEAHIRRRPEQWVWMHDRWRERPSWLVD